MNDQKIFRIDDQKLDLLKRRALNRGLRFVIPTIIIVTLFQYFSYGKNDDYSCEIEPRFRSKLSHPKTANL